MLRTRGAVGVPVWALSFFIRSTEFDFSSPCCTPRPFSSVKFVEDASRGASSHFHCPVVILMRDTDSCLLHFGAYSLHSPLKDR